MLKNCLENISETTALKTTILETNILETTVSERKGPASKCESTVDL